MTLEQTWRWFGPDDPVTLEQIRQTGATGVVTALHHIPAGHVWTVEEIRKRKRMISAAGLTWSVAESIPVHDDIKKRRGKFRRLVENYRRSLINLGRCGVDIVCYNFMPVLDWSRTDLRVVFRDSSITTRFELRAFAAFDLFILKRPGARRAYDDAVFEDAHRFYRTLNAPARKNLLETVLLGFPGSGEQYTLEGLRSAIAGFEGIGEDELRENLRLFLGEIVPAAEEADVLLAIHPDDPPWPLLGLPRVVSTVRDVRHILRAVDTTANGLTFCTGSFGARKDNDVAAMASAFARRITFAHLRNVTLTGRRDFVEDNHLEGAVDMWAVMRALVGEQQRREREGRNDRRMPFRPDHGHLMLPDARTPHIYPGYSLFGRMRGLAELRGLELGIRRTTAPERGGGSRRGGRSRNRPSP